MGCFARSCHRLADLGPSPARRGTLEHQTASAWCRLAPPCTLSKQTADATYHHCRHHHYCHHHHSDNCHQQYCHCHHHSQVEISVTSKVVTHCKLTKDFLQVAVPRTHWSYVQRRGVTMVVGVWYNAHTSLTIATNKSFIPSHVCTTPTPHLHMPHPHHITPHHTHITPHHNCTKTHTTHS